MQNKPLKFKIVFDGETIEWNQKGKEFYVAPTAGAVCVVFYRDSTYEPHFIGEGRLPSFMQLSHVDESGKEVYETIA